MGREEAGLPDRFLVRAVGGAARLLAGAGRSLSGWKLTASQIVAGLKQETRGRYGHSRQLKPQFGRLLHPGHSLGGRYLVGNPDLVAGRDVLRADGELRRHATSSRVSAPSAHAG